MFLVINLFLPIHRNFFFGRLSNFNVNFLAMEWEFSQQIRYFIYLTLYYLTYQLKSFNCSKIGGAGGIFIFESKSEIFFNFPLVNVWMMDCPKVMAKNHIIYFMILHYKFNHMAHHTVLQICFRAHEKIRNLGLSNIPEIVQLLLTPTYFCKF